MYLLSKSGLVETSILLKTPLQKKKMEWGFKVYTKMCFKNMNIHREKFGILNIL